IKRARRDGLFCRGNVPLVVTVVAAVAGVTFPRIFGNALGCGNAVTCYFWRFEQLCAAAVSGVRCFCFVLIHRCLSCANILRLFHPRGLVAWPSQTLVIRWVVSLQRTQFSGCVSASVRVSE